jgi:hypothetical protein
MSARLEKYTKAAEGLGTVVLVGLGVLFAIGTLVVNIHLGSLGLSDFSGLRPRFVLVGLTFLLYLAIPPTFCIAALQAGATVGFGRRPVLAVLTSIAVALVLMVVIPSMLFFAIPYVTYQNRGLVEPVPFWGIYTDSTYSLILHLLVAIPAGILWLWRHPVALAGASDAPKTLHRVPLRRSRGIATRSRVRQHVLLGLRVIVVLAAIGMLYPYATVTFVNISMATGGGHPSIVLMKMDRDVGRVVDRPGFVRWSQAGDTIYGPVLVWHESGDRTFISLPESRTFVFWEVFAIPSEKIGTVWYLPGAIYLENRLSETIIHRFFVWPRQGAGVAPDI